MPQLFAERQAGNPELKIKTFGLMRLSWESNPKSTVSANRHPIFYTSIRDLPNNLQLCTEYSMIILSSNITRHDESICSTLNHFLSVRVPHHSTAQRFVRELVDRLAFRHRAVHVPPPFRMPQPDLLQRWIEVSGFDSKDCRFIISDLSALSD